MTQVALDTSYWTVFNHITIWGSLVFYFILTFFYNFVVAGKHPGTLATAMREPVRVKTLPKAQPTRGLSSYHKFKNKS